MFNNSKYVRCVASKLPLTTVSWIALQKSGVRVGRRPSRPRHLQTCSRNGWNGGRQWPGVDAARQRGPERDDHPAQGPGHKKVLASRATAAAGHRGRGELYHNFVRLTRRYLRCGIFFRVHRIQNSLLTMQPIIRF